MNKSDIKVGEEYAYRASKYGRPDRVRVIDLSGTYSTGWGYNKKTHHGGITVEMVGGHSEGHRFVTTGRSLSSTWAEYEENERLAAERNKRSAELAAATAARRANLAKRIDDRLRAHGEAVYGRLVWDQRNEHALKAAGFEFDEDGRVMAALDLQEVMSKGAVDEKVATILLADAELAVAR